MKTLYLDCFAGISGDMFVGALIDLGLDPIELENELKKISLEGYRLEIGNVISHGIRATAFRVMLEANDGHYHLADDENRELESFEVDQSESSHHETPSRSLKEILTLIDESELSDSVKSLSSEIFSRLGAAEARVHGVQLERVHFHEVGSVDAIIDIVSSAIGLDRLGIESVYSSPLHLGTGFVRSDHGILPVPAPATAELLVGIPSYAGNVRGELVTPTGAAIVTTITKKYGPLPKMTVSAVGYGAGSRSREFPNVLRAYLGEIDDVPGELQVRSSRDPHPEQHLGELEAGGYHEGGAIALEANIDDSNPQLFEHLMELLCDAGALDTILIPVQMKKNRPGVLLQALVHPDDVDDCLQIIFRETTTIGVRSYPVTKHMLKRSFVDVMTEYGALRIKLSWLGEKVINASPEYEDCRVIAVRYRLPLKKVMNLALHAYFQTGES